MTDALSVSLTRAVALARRYERRGAALGFLLGVVVGLVASTLLR